MSIVCNVWFILLLLADRIADTKAARLLRGIADVWKSLHETAEERPTMSQSPVSDNGNACTMRVHIATAM
ncbi:hypothetical protein HKQ52_08785 [Bacteroides vulgatus]|uniref:hypothetical protein n=1 Tax=Phocaeicola vulgatus TaxID=821 RepID=UPI0014707967|nr:hypothetical protein [Phocaeicola vulgatus]NMW71663.1 hypothetical protein [Phocaeicola vulgatus]